MRRAGPGIACTVVRQVPPMPIHGPPGRIAARRLGTEAMPVAVPVTGLPVPARPSPTSR